jgi:hypothetical protein
VQPLLPLPLPELIASIKASDAITAFATKRAVQISVHGHTPESELERPILEIAREAQARLHALGNYVLPGRMNLPAERREQCLRYIEVAGGILLALWDRVQVEVPEE